jgi:hypothetical protein
MWKYLNKGISTPIAISIILILSVALGSFTILQLSEMRKERNTIFSELKFPEKKCSRENPNICNKNCNSDEDCQFTCEPDCGAINKEEKCHYKVIPYSCATKEVKCENNICVSAKKDETAGSSSEASATEGWQTYRNEEYGFEVKYSEDWVVSTGYCSNSYFGTAKNCVSIKYPENSDCSVNIIIDKAQYDNCLRFFSANIENVSFAATPAFKNPSVNGMGINYCISQNNKYFTIFTTEPYISPHRNPAEPLPSACPSGLEEQMLSTFKFINNEPADWKTYRNEEIGIEFQYPKIYDEDEKYKICRVEASKDFISVAGRIWINIIDSGGLSLEEYVNKKIKEPGLLVEDKTVTNDIISLSYRLPGSMAYGTATYRKNPFRNESKIFQIVLEHSDSSCDFDGISIFDVLNNLYSTFKFIEKNETTDWQTYTNKEYGFEIKYPKEWKQSNEEGAITFNSPENEKYLQDLISGKEYREWYVKDIIISYYNSVSEFPENKDNNLGAKTLKEFVEKDPMIHLLDQINFAGEEAYEVIWEGGYEFTQYSILAEKDNHLYLIMFGNRGNKSALTETDNKILSTFKFID